MTRRHVVVTGPMASGKTTVGSELALRLGRPFLDSDDYLVRRTGMSGRELAESSGLAALHTAEVEALLGGLVSSDPSVIAAAASTADSLPALDALRSSGADLVLLDCSPEVLSLRIPEGDHRRPLSIDELSALTSRRRQRLLRLEPVVVVDTSVLSAEAAVERVLAQLVYESR